MKKILISTAVLGSLLISTILPATSTQTVSASTRITDSVYTHCIRCNGERRFESVKGFPGKYTCVTKCGTTVWR